jgi:hypothetical protein
MQKSIATLNKQQQDQALTTGPVELSLDQLEQVSGGLPKGGWGDTTTEALVATISTDSIDATA